MPVALAFLSRGHSELSQISPVLVIRAAIPMALSTAAQVARKLAPAMAPGGPVTNPAPTTTVPKPRGPQSSSRGRRSSIDMTLGMVYGGPNALDKTAATCSRGFALPRRSLIQLQPGHGHR